MIHLGYTGTKKGMTFQQKDRIVEFIDKLEKIELKGFDGYWLHGHHGDCQGGDKEFHEILLEYGSYIVVHPPVNNKYRAFCQLYNKIREPKPYGVRDKDIVKECEMLIAAPVGYQEELHSGTWWTVRIARRLKRNTYIIFPDGSVVLEEYK
jgi:hypothetical protein